jgi:hypothetical protein
MPIDRATIDRAIAELAQAVPASVITDTLPGTRVAIAFKALFATSGDIDAARAYIIGDQRASPIWEHRHDSLLLSESATPSAMAKLLREFDQFGGKECLEARCAWMDPCEA